MPVSYLPCLTPILLVGIPLLMLFRSRRAAGIRPLCTMVTPTIFMMAIYTTFMTTMWMSM